MPPEQKKQNPIRYQKAGDRYIKFQYKLPENYYPNIVEKRFVYSADKNLLKCFKTHEEYEKDRFFEELKGTEICDGLAEEIIKIR